MSRDEGDENSDGVHMDDAGMREEIQFASQDPLAFVTKVSIDSVKHFDAISMVRQGNVTEEEARQLIDLALQGLKKTRKNLQSL